MKYRRPAVAGFAVYLMLAAWAGLQGEAVYADWRGRPGRGARRWRRAVADSALVDEGTGRMSADRPNVENLGKESRIVSVRLSGLAYASLVADAEAALGRLREPMPAG